MAVSWQLHLTWLIFLYLGIEKVEPCLGMQVCLPLAMRLLIPRAT